MVNWVQREDESRILTVRSWPVSQFTYTPGNPLEPEDTTPKYEGVPLRLIDLSFDPDGDEIVSWLWKISGVGIDGELTSKARNPVFVPPGTAPPNSPDLPTT